VSVESARPDRRSGLFSQNRRLLGRTRMLLAIGAPHDRRQPRYFDSVYDHDRIGNRSQDWRRQTAARFLILANGCNARFGIRSGWL
jgi:hypothetical protein